MRFLGLEITRSGSGRSLAVAGIDDEKAQGQPPQSIDTTSGWQRILEPFTGAWQRGVEVETASVITYSTVYACISLISGDVGKLRMLLKEDVGNDVWRTTQSPAFSPVLRRPNRHQTASQFISNWISSKLIHGNAYIMLARDARRIVTDMYVLDPKRVRPLITPDGDVYYELKTDNFSGQEIESYTVPASEIIHDRMVTLHHPLVGVSPITACGIAATQGLKIQEQSSRFFANGARPGGIISAVGKISEDNAKRIKEYWETGFSGDKAGRVAVLGDGLKYEQVIMSAQDAQLIEQLKWTAENICSCFLVPPFMVGVGATPSYSNVQALNLQYYSQCLQFHIESMEALLDEALGLTTPLAGGKRFGVELDLNGLLRMDTPTKVKAVGDSIKAGFMKINEARAQFDMEPVKGGDTPYLQQQNYAIAALADRDANDPFAKPKPAAIAPPSEEDPEETPDGEDKPADEESDQDEVDEEEAAKALTEIRMGWAR